MTSSLLKGIRIVERADTNSMRRVMFSHYAAGKPGVRLVLFAHRLLGRSWLATLMIAAYGLKAFLTLGPPNRPSDLLALARFANARRELESVVSSVGTEHVSWARFGKRLLFSPGSYGALVDQIRRPRSVRRYLRCVARLSRRHDFFVSCRLASTLTLYARSLQLLAAIPAKAVIVSSDYNPEEVALARAARRKGVPGIFVAHAHTNRLSPPLDSDLAILNGEAALEAYRQKGPVTSRVVFRGVEGEGRALDPGLLLTASPIAGIFLPTQIRWETLRAIVAGLRQRYHPRRLRLRWHPNMLESRRLDLVTDDLAGIDISPKGTPLVEDAQRCHFVIADENSNVHLAVLKAGVPTLAIEGIGVHPPDMVDHYGFIRNGIIPPLVPSLDALVPDDVAAFYGQGWKDRFRYYDGGYMQRQEDIDREVGRAIREVSGLF